MDLVVKLLLVVAGVVWAFSGVWLSAIDLRKKILPRRIIYPTSMVVLGLYAVATIIERDILPLAMAFTGGIGCFAIFYALYLISPKLMGGGDVRLVGLNGFILGWFGWHLPWLAIAGGVLLAFPISLVLLAFKGARAGIPFGPYLIAGTGFFLTFELVYFINESTGPFS